MSQRNKSLLIAVWRLGRALARLIAVIFLVAVLVLLAFPALIFDPARSATDATLRAMKQITK